MHGCMNIMLFQHFNTLSVTKTGNGCFIVETAVYLFSNKLVVLDCRFKQWQVNLQKKLFQYVIDV